jgi:16S rRNA (guanine527-N7)-methyltransferase
LFHVKPADPAPKPSMAGWAPPPPPVAAEVFGDRLGLVCRYAELVAGAGVERGLVGPREVPRLWERHLLNCAVLTELIAQGAHVADVGSGAGLPGIVLALARPDLRVQLIEPLLRRATFLSEVVEDLGLTDVDIVRDRAELLEGRAFDVVTARAVAPLEKLLRWTLPLLRPGGAVLALKGSSAGAELEAARPVLARWPVSDAELLTIGVGVLEVPATVVRVRVAAALGRRR